MTQSTPTDGRALADEEYINLLSFKRNGEGVQTPVWCAPLDDKLVVFTLRDSFKVKRIRRNSAVKVAKCDLRGKLLGPWRDATCTIVEDAAREDRAYAALRRKYGWKMRVGDVLSRLSGRIERRLVMEIALA